MHAKAMGFLSVARDRAHSTASLMVMLAALLATALSVAASSPASAQAPLLASVSSTMTRTAGPCTNGAYICGTANISGYGAATWNLYPTGGAVVVSPCGSTYTAVTYFTVVSDPGSTLVLDESGNDCGLGHDGAAYRGYFAEGSQAFGHPFALVGSWTVDPASTGQFSGLTGSGTDVIRIAGASVAGTYSGTLS